VDIVQLVTFGWDRNNPRSTLERRIIMEDADAKEIERINQMSQYDMASLWRHAPSGHPYFDSSKPYYEIFKKRFDSLGGFTPEISKSIG